VGSFTSTVTLSNPLLSWTNPAAAASIDRTQDFRVTWTGGNPGTYVVISGSSTVRPAGAVGPANVIVGAFTCLAPAEAGQFTVPSYILLGIPAGTGATELQNIIYSSLSATGLDIGVALGTISRTESSTFIGGPASGGGGGLGK
jgi:hypothetical protein